MRNTLAKRASLIFLYLHASVVFYLVGACIVVSRSNFVPMLIPVLLLAPVVSYQAPFCVCLLQWWGGTKDLLFESEMGMLWANLARRVAERIYSNKRPVPCQSYDYVSAFPALPAVLCRRYMEDNWELQR